MLISLMLRYAHSLSSSANSKANMDSSSNLAIIAILASCVGALVWVIKHLFAQILPALEGLQRATEGNTAATKSADEYLRQRNGRDMEFHAEVMKSLADIPIQSKKQADIVARELKRVGDITAAKLKEVGTQTVAEQKVEHQVINNN